MLTLGTCQEKVKAGVSLGRAKATETGWEQWCLFCCQLALDPFLETFEDKVPFLQVFGQRVRDGELAKDGNSVRARTAEDYIRFVAQTFLGVGSPDPRYGEHNKIDFRIGRMIAAWKKEDPPTKRVKPIPVQVIRRILFIASTSSCEMVQANADMICIAFFFLLRPGEYTDETGKDKHPFRLCDVQLFYGRIRIDLATATVAQIRQATFATLTFTTQKNGVPNEVIGLGLSGNPHVCPVKSVIRRVLHLRAHNAPMDVPLARVMGMTRKVTAATISQTLKTAVAVIGPELGFLPKDISARSLRAAGAMALLLARVDTDIISLIGRWRSDEMLRYLHVQAAPLMAEYSRRMLEAGSYSLLPHHDVPMH